MQKTVRLAILILFAMCCGLAIVNGGPAPTPAQGHHRITGAGVTRPSRGTLKPPPPPVETPTTLTLYENPDMTGASYTISIKPLNGFQATRVVNHSDIAGAGLDGKISSARIVCGTRPSRASLFDIDWGEFSSGTMIECTPNQAATINLTADTLGRDLNDKIGAAGLVAHVRSSDNLTHGVSGFSTLFGSVWRKQMQSLGGGATAKDTRIWVEDFQDIDIWQMLQVDSPWCSARGAVFTMRINLSASAFRPVFKVYATSLYVDSGFGDMWGCHDDMVKELNAGLAAASKQLESQLPNLVLGNPSSAVYYFAPEGNTQDYDLFYWK